MISVAKAGNSTNPSPFVLEEVTDPEELAQARAHHEQFRRNAQWLQDHVNEAYAPENRGKYICISGQQLFVGDSVAQVRALAAAACPADDGSFVEYVPELSNVARIYCHAN